MKRQETTLVQRADSKVTGFKKLHKQLEKKIIVSGKSLSTLNNYMRCIAHVALPFNVVPSELDIEQIEEERTLSLEFIRRFSLHILPKGFMRIGHYGILSSSRNLNVLPLLHQQLESHYEYPEEKHWKQVSIERLDTIPMPVPTASNLQWLLCVIRQKRAT